jgi:hypothetical protein
MLEKIEKIQELLNVPNVDASTETAIANMKILNLLVDLRAEAEQLILFGVSNWVAISDRKPPKEWSNYMVCLENNSIFQANYCRIGTERWLVVGVGEITNENPVLYWMEEPKPPCC